MRLHTNLLEALIYYADASAATVEGLAHIKSKSLPEFKRHINITFFMILDCRQYDTECKYTQKIDAVMERLRDAVKTHNETDPNPKRHIEFSGKSVLMD